MDKTEALTTAAPSAKQKIATMARKLERNAPNADLEIFYGAVAEEFERQLTFDSARTKAPSSALATK